MRLQLGLIKIEINLPDIASTLEEFARDRKKAFESLVSEVKSSMSETLNSLLKHEIELFLGRPDQQDNKLNGHYVREYSLKGFGAIRIKMPRDRKGNFESAVVPRHERMDPRLKEDIAILHLSGISTRTLAMISKRLLGVEVSAKTISNSLNVVAEAADNWLSRPLTQPYWALYIDGTNFNIQRRGSTQKEPSLVVLGIDASNRRSILAIEPGTRDNCDAWRAVFRDLKRRGLDPSHVRVGIMDGLPGLERLFKEEFCEAVTARCWAHAMRNACAKAPERLRDSFKLLADKVMYASSEGAALHEFKVLKELLGNDCERAVKCLEKDLESLTVHYRFDQRFWRALKTTNCIERIHKEFKRRTKSMESLGERSLKSVLVFTALKLEMGWRMKAVDSSSLKKFGIKSENIIEHAVEEMGLLH
jgi:putative transposase